MHQILEIITRVSLKFTVAGTLPFLQAGLRSFLSIVSFKLHPNITNLIILIWQAG